MAASSIEWTDATWNPTTGCTRASAGCDHCYAFTMTKRLAAMGQEKYQGLAGNGHFNGVLKMWDDELQKPLKWKKPRMVFVNSMSDLFHKDVPFEFIDKVFAIMAITPQHTYQVLTKRPERMAEYLETIGQACKEPSSWTRGERLSAWAGDALDAKQRQQLIEASDAGWWEWQRMPNVWLGTSVENQQAADERIPHLLRCPAAVRFLSCEPLLGPINLREFTGIDMGNAFEREALAEFRELYPDGLPDNSYNAIYERELKAGNSSKWAIVGGESGGGARVCQTQWVRSIVRQCESAEVPVFVKQLGAKVGTDHRELDSEQLQAGGRLFLKDKKGGTMEEWPQDLRVRQFPTPALTT